MSAQRSRSVGTQGILRRQRHADTRPHAQACVTYVDRFFEQRRKASRHRGGLEGVRTVKQDCELVTAEAHDEIAVTDDLADTRPDLAQERVPSVVSEGVVDLLEMIQVDQEQGHAV